MNDETVLLAHGSGGSMMKRIIDEVFFEAYAGDVLRRADDAAVLPSPPAGSRIAFSTDTFVVHPHFFPGGDIGRLAICGTVNCFVMFKLGKHALEAYKDYRAQKAAGVKDPVFHKSARSDSSGVTEWDD